MTNDSSSSFNQDSMEISDNKKHNVLFPLIVIFFALDLISFFIQGYYSTADEWGLGGLAVFLYATVPLAFITFFLAIVGVARLRRRLKLFSVLIILLLIIVPTMFGFFSLSRPFFSFIYSPLREIESKKATERFHEIKKEHLQFFKTELSSEKTIAAISCGGVVTLNNGIKVTLERPFAEGSRYYGTDKGEQLKSDVEEKMKASLIGKRITILMPTEEDFLNNYIPGSANDCYQYTHDDWPKHGGEFLGELVVDAEVGGELVNLKSLGLTSSYPDVQNVPKLWR
ncbi:MAG: hypothetical protein Q7S05_03030 [bacterium]|nr:hypothetical protein [bacterium]